MGAMMFGKGEVIHCIADVGLTGANGEALCLGFKLSRYSFVAPVYLRDDGYVLRLKDAKESYYPMPVGEELAGMQADGLIPAPLPPYSVPLYEWAFGFLLWIVIGGLLAWEGVKWMFRRDPIIAEPPSSMPTTGPGPIG